MLKNILLVDDDNLFREGFIECFDGLGIIEASSGEEALEILLKPNDIDLVILDVNMSGINGIETLKKINKMIGAPSIIILTGHSSTDVAIEALRGHADDYIEKPCDIDKTREIIKNILDKRSENRGIITNGLEAKIEKVKHFLERNCSKRVHLEDAADLVFLSPKYLSRVFKQFVGMDFTDYRLLKKIDLAKELLLNPNYNINQVAEKLGYQNSESFSRQFKKFITLTPTQFCRKMARKNKKRNKSKG